MLYQIRKPIRYQDKQKTCNKNSNKHALQLILSTQNANTITQTAQSKNHYNFDINNVKKNQLNLKATNKNTTTTLG